MPHLPAKFARFMRGAPVALLLSCSPARADVIADWNAIALQTVRLSEPQPIPAAHAMATVHLAMFEVMNFVEGRYPSRVLVRPVAPLGESGAAAAAAAAHHVLGEMYPGRMAALDKALERSLAAVPDATERSNARIWGSELGRIVLMQSRDAGGTACPASPTSSGINGSHPASADPVRSIELTDWLNLTP